MTMRLFLLLGITTVRTKCVCVWFAWTKRLFNLPAEATINVFKARSQIRCAKFSSNNKQTRCSSTVTEVYILLKGAQDHFRMLLETSFVLISIVSTEKCWITWRLCNKFEFHLRFWKVWSLVVCSQTSFCVTRAHRGDKNRQNTLLLC